MQPSPTLLAQPLSRPVSVRPSPAMRSQPASSVPVRSQAASSVPVQPAKSVTRVKKGVVQKTPGLLSAQDQGMYVCMYVCMYACVCVHTGHSQLLRLKIEAIRNTLWVCIYV